MTQPSLFTEETGLPLFSIPDAPAPALPFRSTINQALDLAERNEWDAAYAAAREDEGLDSNCTFEEWQQWVRNALARRAKEKASNYILVD